MNNYESRELLNMPMPKHFDKMTDEELAGYLTRSRNYNILIPMLIEANRRKDTVITSKSIDRKYERYCRELGFIKKENHKTRKTCLTKIADNLNINLKDAMQFSGRRDVQTYIKHYVHSRYSDEQKRNELEKTLNSNQKDIV